VKGRGFSRFVTEKEDDHTEKACLMARRLSGLQPKNPMLCRPDKAFTPPSGITVREMTNPVT
jgi:hypothetical protein